MAEYTIDYNRGSDSNDGLSAPWQNLSKLSGTFADGDIVVLNDESTWDFAIDGRQGFGTLGTNFTLVRSGTNGSQKPTLRRKPAVAAGSWTYDAPNNGWYTDLGFVPGVMTGIMLGGAHWAHKQVDALPLVSSDYTWREGLAGDGPDIENWENRLWLYAPAGTDPTTYYGEVIVCSGDRGLLTLSSDGNFVTIDGVAFDDFGLGILLYANNGVRQYTVKNCETAGGKLVLVNSDTAGTLTAIIEHNTCRVAPSSFIQTLGSVGQGRHTIRYNNLAGCNYGFPQGAIYVQNLSGADVRFNEIADARFGNAFQTTDGCAIYAEVGANDVDVVGNLVRNCHLAFQDNSGRRTTWAGNITEYCYAAMKVGDDDAVGATDISYHNNTHMYLGHEVPTLGAGNVATIGFRMLDVGSDILRVINNLFHTVSSDTQPAIETPASAAAGAEITTNLVYGFTTAAAAYNGAAASPTPTGTITDNPLLDENYRPLAGSPCIGAGTYLQGVKHFGGCAMNPNSPDIGAHRYFTARTRTTRSITTRSTTTRSNAINRDRVPA